MQKFMELVKSIKSMEKSVSLLKPTKDPKKLHAKKEGHLRDWFDGINTIRKQRKESHKTA